MSPGFFAIHPTEPNAPEEEVILLEQAFLTTTPEAMMNVPSYSKWLEEQDHVPAYQALKRMMQYLQWQRPGIGPDSDPERQAVDWRDCLRAVRRRRHSQCPGRHQLQWRPDKVGRVLILSLES